MPAGTPCGEPERAWSANRIESPTRESLRAKSHRVLRAYCKSKRAVSRENVYFLRAPHTLAMRRILRALSRIRAELAGESSLAIRRGQIYGSSKERSCRRGRQEL